MLRWLEALIAGIIIIIIIIILIFLILRRFTTKQTFILTDQTTREPKTTPSQTQLSIKRRPSYNLLGRGSSTKSYFNWVDHPSLITDVAENGWSRFAFTNHGTSSTVRSSLFNSLRVTSELVEESWEIGGESVDFMQKVKFKKGLNSNSATVITTRMSLPLPGPPMVESFPKEAYFEIMILDLKEDNNKGKFSNSGEGEKIKLLFKQSNSTGLLFHVSSSRGSHLLEELKLGGGGRRGGVAVKMTVGLSVGSGGGGFVAGRVPGSYPGSIGFNSDGSVFLGGMKLVFESEKEDWAKTGKVIGCGFNPKEKKVYFTVDSELIHVIHCKSEDFGMPLYPILATTLETTILVNLGQSIFSYTPSNAHRTPNPCFMGPIINSSPGTLGYEDSRELFSMGRIDSEWLEHGTTITSTISNTSDYFGNVAENEEGETEFFEIVLDSKGR